MKTKDEECLAITQKVITCHACGYDFLGDKLPKNYRCPKCFSFSFEEINVPESVYILFENILNCGPK